MRIPWGIASKAKRLFVSSPAKANSANGGNPLSEFDYNGIKEEVFFDSKGWLDSDCEDDFYSINGDMTPSRGNTPNYQTSTPATPRLNKVHFVDTLPDTKSESSPTGRKMKLADLLSDKQQGEVDDEAISGEVKINKKADALKTNTNRLRKFWNGSPRVYKANSVYTRDENSDRISNSSNGRTGKAKHCCMPGFSHTLGLNDKKKHKMSPEH